MPIFGITASSNMSIKLTDFYQIATSTASTGSVAYGVPLASGAVLTFTIGATLDATDVITVYSTNGTSSFSAFGSEIS